MNAALRLLRALGNWLLDTHLDVPGPCAWTNDTHREDA